MGNFNHLHVHTEYSKLDGYSKIPALIDKAIRLGHKAMAVTDHGSTSGLLCAQKYVQDKDIKLIYGTEFYMCSGLDEEGKKKRKSGHIIMLAKNYKGLQNIWRLQDLAHNEENFYYKPRITYEMLHDHCNDVIVTSACLANSINQSILNGDIAQAEQDALDYSALFGEDFYLEIQPNSIMEQHMCNKELIRISKEYNIQLVATNDVHYTNQDEAYFHEVLLALSQRDKGKWSNPKRFKFPSDDFWFKTEEEMREGLTSYDQESIDSAINNTSIIADKCEEFIIPSGNYLPEYHTIPEGSSERELLGEVLNQGWREKQHEIITDKNEYMKAVHEELAVIEDEGLNGYFMIEQDTIRRAREKGCIIGPGRGSGLGSKVAFLSGITEVEPEQYHLLFERFLSKGREPDIDTDCSDIDIVFEVLVEKYGWDSVARIQTNLTMTVKSLTRKVLSIFGFSQREIAMFSGQIGQCETFREALATNPRLMDMFDKLDPALRIKETIFALEGNINSSGKHAGGIIICPGMSEILPLTTDPTNRKKRIIAFDMDELHDLGHWKFDFLGLKTLSLLAEVLRNIQKTKYETIDLKKINYEDERVYAELRKGRSFGVFQLEAQAHLLMEQRLNCFRDIIAVNAMLRPGCVGWKEYIDRRNGKKFSIHPDREWYMRETYGVIAYQEQFELDCKTFAGWTIAYADKNVRKNSDIKNDTALKEKFFSDGASKNYNIDVLDFIWKEIIDAVDGGYAFNKSHATGYAKIAYQTAWLKVNYPVEFFAGLLTLNSDNSTKVGEIINECKRLNINILPPSIERPSKSFEATGSGIRFSISSLNKVGDSAVRFFTSNTIDFSSIEEFVERTPRRPVSSAVIEALIKSGCFDSTLGKDRERILYDYNQHRRTKSQIRDGYDTGRIAYVLEDRQSWEKYYYGFYLTSHPLEKYKFSTIEDTRDGDDLCTVATIDETHVFRDKNGNEMLFAKGSNQYEVFKIIVFSSTFSEKLRKDLVKDNVLLINGTKSNRDVILNSYEVI